MNINYELFKIFVEVVKCGTITEAASNLNISQPAVTQGIKTLESQIGGTLFIRTRKGVILTEEGSVLYDYISEGINYITNGINKFKTLKNLEEGKLYIGTTSSIAENMLIPFIKKYKEKYPNIEIKIYNELTSNLIKSLKNGDIDLAIITKISKIDSSLSTSKICDLHDIFVSNTKISKKNINDLLNEGILIQYPPSVTRTNFDSFIKNLNLEYNPKMEIVSHGLLVKLTENGFGNSVLTKEFITNELNKTLFEIKTDINIPSRELVLVTRKDRLLSFAASSFVKIIKESVKN